MKMKMTNDAPSNSVYNHMAFKPEKFLLFHQWRELNTRNIDPESVEEIILNQLTDYVLWLRCNPDRAHDRQFFGYSTLFIIFDIYNNPALTDSLRKMIEKDSREEGEVEYLAEKMLNKWLRKVREIK